MVQDFVHQPYVGFLEKKQVDLPGSDNGLIIPGESMVFRVDDFQARDTIPQVNKPLKQNNWRFGSDWVSYGRGVIQGG